MNDFRLNEDTLRTIQATTGMDASFISESDISVIDCNIEKKTGKTLEPAISFAGLNPRGSVYLMFKRFFTSKEIDEQLAAIK